MSDRQTFAPGAPEIERLAEEALQRLPETFRRHLQDVVLQIQEFADEEVLDQLGIEDPFDLTGLYQGVDLASRSVMGPAPEASMVFLYRRPILDEWAEHGEITLQELVTHVLVHEIGHHFGLSDAQIHAIEAQAD